MEIEDEARFVAVGAHALKKVFDLGMAGSMNNLVERNLAQESAIMPWCTVNSSCGWWWFVSSWVARVALESPGDLGRCGGVAGKWVEGEGQIRSSKIKTDCRFPLGIVVIANENLRTSLRVVVLKW